MADKIELVRCDVSKCRECPAADECPFRDALEEPSDVENIGSKDERITLDQARKIITVPGVFRIINNEIKNRGYSFFNMIQVFRIEDEYLEVEQVNNLLWICLPRQFLLDIPNKEILDIIIDRMLSLSRVVCDAINNDCEASACIKCPIKEHCPGPE